MATPVELGPIRDRAGRGGGEGRTGEKAEKPAERNGLEDRIVRKPRESIEKVAAPADHQQAGENAASDHCVSAQAQHRSAIRAPGVRSCPAGALSHSMTSPMRLQTDDGQDGSRPAA